MRPILREIRRLAAAAGPVERWRNPRRIVIPDRDERWPAAPGELAALERIANDPQAAAYRGRIYVPYPSSEQATDGRQATSSQPA